MRRAAELTWADRVYSRAHNEPQWHANFDVQGLGERDDTRRHQEEHDEEEAIGYGGDDGANRLHVICRGAERRRTRRRNAIARRPATSDGRFGGWRFARWR